MLLTARRTSKPVARLWNTSTIKILEVKARTDRGSVVAKVIRLARSSKSYYDWFSSKVCLYRKPTPSFTFSTLQHARTPSIVPERKANVPAYSSSSCALWSYTPKGRLHVQLDIDPRMTPASHQS